MTVHDLVKVLPGPDVLLARCRAYAALDAELGGEWPYHRFQPRDAEGVAVAEWESGGGDEYRVVFDPAGVLLIGFDHESPATPWRVEPRAHWPGLLDGVPAALAHHLTDPAFLFDGFLDATVCVWREAGAAAWSCGPVLFDGYDDADADGADWLFETLVGGVDAYVAFAEDIYGRPVDRGLVASVVAGSST
ncbi:hypothetical protein [Streptomyces alkaliterrae]|uniref:Uncharacterized protein n=1 Tax=Streptomyces alkaliterrae TaxID=2213162 RepID=A0A5P0YT72_9ACTN|nr:hypothetical protein [Streptomyces alkaliterrae]MBB1255127.1 hypothetical protein [Streptomyces alkaliterrae]MBB1259839.1 hypothetical protein [Streptomyces alkaliterrae]MQS03516.1 hypothetical protein [Streptomyces alkaliterrae]